MQRRVTMSEKAEEKGAEKGDHECKKCEEKGDHGCREG